LRQRLHPEFIHHSPVFRTGPGATRRQIVAQLLDL
jgi:hypothetical protein